MNLIRVMVLEFFQVGSESPLNGIDAYNLSANAEKEDVYQLGVILVQVITGRLVTSQSELEELRIQVKISRQRHMLP